MRYWICLAVTTFAMGTSARSAEIQVVSSPNLRGPAEYGVRKLCEVLTSHGHEVVTFENIDQASGAHVIVAGLASDPTVSRRIADGGLALPERPESLAIRRVTDDPRQLAVLCGADNVGLMYAALDTAQRIGWATGDEQPFAHLRNTSESPRVIDRGVSTYTMQRRWFEQRLYDPTYWEQYFDLLANSRINNFVIVFGYECGGFMAPLYPYFFDIDEFPDVKLTGISAQEQSQNTAALQRVIQLAHERGIRITIGIWDHIYRGGVQGGGIEGASDLVGKQVPHLVYGVTTDNLPAYTKAGLKKFLQVFPEVDAIQFRMHWESGITREETPGFWNEVFAMLHEQDPDISFELRAKDLPDEVIDDAIDQGLSFRIATKYWMEQMGLPFHPTHVNPQNQHDRRHGYADLLRYPKRYNVHWRLWTGGTARFLLWGDPDYVRRFIDSTRLYAGDSFEVNEMLATKMLGASHDADPFQLHSRDYQHYDYEFQRYWHYFQLWGRLSFDPQLDPEVWQREFARRFGEQAGPRLMRGLHRASGILPRIVAASYDYRYFPTTRGWAEMMRLGDLPQYAEGTGTDVEQFQSYREAARQLLSHEPTALCPPQRTAAWFDEVARQVLDDVDAAGAPGDELSDQAKREFLATTTDLRILAHLAQYHASRMRAAVWFNVYRQTEDEFVLNQCLAAESRAIEAWKSIIAAAGDVYSPSLQFGVHRVGFSHHWNEELSALEEGYAELQNLPLSTKLDDQTRDRLLQDFQSRAARPFALEVQRVESAAPGEDLVITAWGDGTTEIEQVRLRYRHVTQFEDYDSVPMVWDATLNRYTGTIPGKFVVPEWDLMYFVEAISQDGHGRKAPYFEQEQPYVIVPVRRR